MLLLFAVCLPCERAWSLDARAAAKAAAAAATPRRASSKPTATNEDASTTTPPTTVVSLASALLRLQLVWIYADAAAAKWPSENWWPRAPNPVLASMMRFGRVAEVTTRACAWGRML